MIDPRTFRLWGYRLLFVLIGGVLTFVLILPLSLRTGLIPGPDLMLALIFAWSLRRPEYVPILLVAGLVFLTDMLMQNPPGLRAALVLLGLEFLRGRGGGPDMPFAAEWSLVIAIMSLILLGERLVLGVFMVEQVSFGKSILRLVVTAATYPLVVAVSVYLFRVRRVAPGEADALRQRA